MNGSIVPLKTELKSGDIVEIMTSKKGHPSESWLKFVKSPERALQDTGWLREDRESVKKRGEIRGSAQQKERKDGPGLHSRNDEHVQAERPPKAEARPALTIDGTVQCAHQALPVLPADPRRRRGRVHYPRQGHHGPQESCPSLNRLFHRAGALHQYRVGRFARHALPGQTGRRRDRPVQPPERHRGRNFHSQRRTS